MSKTYMHKAENARQGWYIVDAKGRPLGRLAAAIARILQGKHKPIYTPHVDTGDCVVVINARDILLTGNKKSQKLYKRFSGYPGGLRLVPAETMLQKRPEGVLKLAVQRMLPKSKLGRKMLGKLKVYKGPEHPHEAQRPEPLEL